MSNVTTAYGRAALIRALASIADGGEGRNITLNREAFSIAQLVAGNEIGAAEAFAAIEDAALDAGLSPAEVRGTLRSAFNAGQKTPRSAPTARSQRRQATIAPVAIPKPIKAPETPQKAGFQPWMEQLWRAGKPIAGEALDYLKARNCRIPPADGHLRCLASLPHRPSGKSGPAIIGLITHAVTREPLGIHRTWVSGDGTKPFTPSKMMAGSPLTGGVIRIWSDDAVNGGLAITEGIENALSLAWSVAPVWAATSAALLARFPPLDGIESLLIGADGDKAGIEAAHRCAMAWSKPGRSVQILTLHKGDLNDALREVAV